MQESPGILPSSVVSIWLLVICNDFFKGLRWESKGYKDNLSPEENNYLLLKIPLTMTFKIPCT